MYSEKYEKIITEFVNITYFTYSVKELTNYVKRESLRGKNYDSKIYMRK